MTSPDDCPHRRDVRPQDAPETAACAVLATTFGSADERLVRVERAACTACCTAGGSAHPRSNHVLASLIYHRAHQVLTGQPLRAEADHFIRLKEEARSRLRYSLPPVNRACRRPEGRLGRVGLVGWNTPTGLGYQNRDLAVHLPVARWLAPRHPRFARFRPPRLPGEYWAPWSRCLTPRAFRPWLSGLDWLLFVEHPYVPRLVQEARDRGIGIACVPNWEWLTPDLDWLPHVDVMICPTQATFRMLGSWRRELGFTWEVVHVPWPIDPQRFPFRRRERCRRFLFVNGTGGVRARRADGSMTPYHRKGVEVLAAAARLLKSVPFLAYSLPGDLPALPENVEVRRAPRDNRDLYAEGDVCVLPSHWEGLGLQHLECQAAGLPLVTTDAPPMNECRPFRTVPVAETERVTVCGEQPLEAHRIQPEALAEVLHALHGSDLREASEQARAYIEQERSWLRRRDVLAAWLTA